MDIYVPTCTMCIKTNLYTCFANCVIHGLVRKSKDNSIGTFVYPVYHRFGSPFEMSVVIVCGFLVY